MEPRSRRTSSSGLEVFPAQAALREGGEGVVHARILADKQLFPCRQIRVYDNDHLTANSWYAFGKMDDGGRLRGGQGSHHRACPF